jgi:CRISPR-associated protein Cas6
MVGSDHFAGKSVVNLCEKPDHERFAMPETQDCIDLAFQIMSPTSIPSDHGYALFASISKMLPAIHESNAIAIHPISGTQVGNRQMQLNGNSRLTLRIGISEIPSCLPLAGKLLDVSGAKIQVGVPEIRTLIPSDRLTSRLVTTKNCLDQTRFEAELKRQVGNFGAEANSHYSIGKRRTLRISDKEIVGYEVVFESLSPALSLAIQVNGIGGRRHMGCGVFVPTQRGSTP